MSRTRLALLVVLTLILPTALATPARAGRKGSKSAFKLRIKRPKGKADVGELAEIRVKARNRTREARTARLILTFEGSDTPAHEELISFESRERKRLEIAVRLPAEYRGKKLGLTASFENEDAEDETKVKCSPPEDGTAGPDEWERGRALFAANCAACHEVSDHEIRDEDLDDWLEAVREGEDDMPPIPGLSAADVRLMREYALDPDRGAPPSNDDAEWLRGREVYSANCAACHGDRGNDIRKEDFGDWKEAIFEGEDDMPTFPSLSLDDVRAMRKYVLDPDRVVSEPPPPPPPPPTGGAITYEGAVKAILTARCVACHRQSNALGSIRLDTYATAFQNRAALVDSVVKDRMPPSSALGAGDKDTLQSWLDDGALEK